MRDTRLLFWLYVVIPTFGIAYCFWAACASMD